MDHMNVVGESSDEEEMPDKVSGWDEYVADDSWGSEWLEPVKSVDEPPPRAPELPVTRRYQQEMLDESLTRNLIIAMDTGSGKTLIAILRMKAEVEREARKVIP